MVLTKTINRSPERFGQEPGDREFSLVEDFSMGHRRNKVRAHLTLSL